jgi:hypothetical protein
MHVFYFNKSGQAIVNHFLREKTAGHNAGDVAIVIQHMVGYLAHQTSF